MMRMRFDLVVLGVILAGTAFAVPVQETFASNKEKILVESTSIIDDWVFSVGRTKQTLRAGDEIGFSKAAVLAYSNLDLLNFMSAQWPFSVNAEERKAAWMIYRSKHPFSLTIDGGQRVYSSKTDKDKYLVVMAFPSARVFMNPPRREDLDAAISQYRDELKRMTEEAAKIVAERSGTNRLDVQNAQIESREDVDDGVKKRECFDANLMF